MMIKRHELRDRIHEAAEAHTDLNMFYACISLMEGGHVSAAAHPDQVRLVALCRKAAEKCLRRYDRAVARTGATPYWWMKTSDDRTDESPRTNPS